MINIGKVIFSRVRDIVDDKVYPLIAEKGTTTPFVIYRRSVGLPQNTKDAFIFKYRHSVELKIITDTYDEGISLATSIISRLDGFRGTVEDIKVVESKIVNISEAYQSDAYVQTLVFQIDTE